MVFPAVARLTLCPVCSPFQSLIGFYGFSGGSFDAKQSFGFAFVSIPDRVLWFFRLTCSRLTFVRPLVSIPDRVLWFFRLNIVTQAKANNMTFQSLIGFYGFSG